MGKYYVAYGSNLNLAQMGYRCPESRLVATGVLKGYRLLFKGRYGNCYCTIRKERGCCVPIGIFYVSERDIVCLDRYEGYPMHYRRASLKMTDIDILQQTEKVSRPFVYIMNENIGALGAPSNYYFNTVLQGYADCGLEQRYLYEALNCSIGYNGI